MAHLNLHVPPIGYALRFVCVDKPRRPHVAVVLQRDDGESVPAVPDKSLHEAEVLEACHTHIRLAFVRSVIPAAFDLNGHVFTHFSPVEILWYVQQVGAVGLDPVCDTSFVLPRS